AMPRPAAMPAMGPRKRDMPLRWAAAAVPAAAPAAGAVALRVALGAAVGGVAGARWVVTLRDCVPKLLPPPARRASASKGMASIPTEEIARTAMARNRVRRCDIMNVSCVRPGTPRAYKEITEKKT